MFVLIGTKSSGEGKTQCNTWFDVDDVDTMVDVLNSAVGLAANEVARRKNRVFLAIGPANLGPDRSEAQSQPAAWTYATGPLANVTGKRRCCQAATPGSFSPRLLTAVVENNGGKVPGHVRAPINNSDFSSFHFCCRRRRPGPRRSASPMPAAIPSTRSSRPPSSASRRAGSASSAPGVGERQSPRRALTETWGNRRPGAPPSAR
jgi:hypothetical protein